jgi:hypothetical protein
VAASVTATAFDTVYNGDSPWEENVTIAVASGDTQAVLVVHQGGSGGPVALASILFDGVAMTEITGSPYGGADWRLSGYYIDVSAKSPGSYNCEIRYSNTPPDDSVICCYVLADADAPTDWTEDSGASTTLIDIAVPSAADGVTIWAIRQDVDTTLTPGGGETEIYDGQFSGPGVWYYASGYYKASTGATTTSNIAMDSGNWEGIGLFVPAVAAATPVLSLPTATSITTTTATPRVTITI